MKALYDSQLQYFRSGATRDVRFRRRMLLKLRKAIYAYEGKIAEALKADLGKGATESYMSEIGMVLAGLGDTLRHLRRWTRPKRVAAPLAQFPSTCKVMPEPYGVTLIMSPWNYPVLLCLDPLIAALSAGNCCIVKPASMSCHVSAVLKEMLESIFPPEYVAVVWGGNVSYDELLSQPFDYIFFTGSPRVGKIVMRAAAEHLTPVTLELGGKSPCLLTESADVRVAARRIAFGKTLNSGQTCVAPDYALMPHSMKDAFVAAFNDAVREMLGETPLTNDAYPHIINRRHFDRLCGLLGGEGVLHLCGGQSDPESLRIEPTLLGGVTADSPCMQEEIFGPILPILCYDRLEEAEQFITTRPKPLACYIFSGNSQEIERLLQKIPFGGGCVNDTIIHLAVHELPFGGVGNSGMGSYHGKAGFDTFTHHKSVLRKATWLDLPFRYQPFSSFKDAVLRLFLR